MLHLTFHKKSWKQCSGCYNLLRRWWWFTNVLYCPYLAEEVQSDSFSECTNMCMCTYLSTKGLKENFTYIFAKGEMLNTVS